MYRYYQKLSFRIKGGAIGDWKGAGNNSDLMVHEWWGREVLGETDMEVEVEHCVMLLIGCIIVGLTQTDLN